MTPEEIKAKYARALKGEETFAQAVARSRVSAASAPKGPAVAAKPSADPAPPAPEGWTPTTEQGPPAPTQVPSVPGSGAAPSSQPVQPNPNLKLPDTYNRIREEFAAMDPATQAGDWLVKHIKRKWSGAAPTRAAMLDALSTSAPPPMLRK